MPSSKSNYHPVMRAISISAIIILLAIGLYFSIKINPHSFSWIISTIINFILAIFVYLKDKKNPVNITFGLFSIFVALWSFAVFGLYMVNSEITAFLWSRIAFFGMFFISPAFLHFVFVLTKSLNEKNKKLLYVSYGMAVVFLILNWLGVFVTDFIKVGVKYTPKISIVYAVWLLNLAFWIGCGLVVLFRQFKITKDNRERNQIKYLLGGLIIAMVLCFTNVLLSFGMKIYPIASFTTVIYTSIVAYAIVKYQLMDIRVIISKGLAYATLAGVITTTYVVTVGIFQGILGATLFKQVSLLVNALVAMFIAVGFQPLKNRIRTTVDKLFFKEKYNPQKILKEFVWSLASAIDVDKILNLVINTVTGTLHISKTTIFLANPNSGKFTIKASDSSKGNINEGIYFHKDEFLPRWLKEKNRIFNREEFEFRLTEKEFSEKEKIVETLNKLKELDASLSIPLKVKDRLIGIFTLGQKMSEEMFTPEDIEFLTTLANQAGIALENAQLYEEMRGLEKNLSRADKLSALGTLASSIAHEIKNPLVAIKTFTQLLPRKFNDPEFQEKYNQIVPQELDRLENILNELLNFSRPSRDLVESVEIEKNIDEILLFLENEIFKSKVKVIKEYQKNLPGFSVNPEQMKQVFLNLILNALQAMPEGGSLTIATALLNGPTKEQVQIRFTDTGCGIREENLKNIFKPFFSTKEEGTGLGLAIVKQIVKEHNGAIEVFSNPNQGTTFLINLPLG